MALANRLETTVDLKASADEHFKKWRSEAHHIPKVVNHHVHGVEVHEGDWETHGSVKEWTFRCGDKIEKFKERIEILDEEQRRVKLVGMGGEVFKEFKSFDVVFQFDPKPEEGCSAKLVYEYEKMNENVASPTRYMEVLQNLIKDMDEHLVKGNQSKEC